MNINFIKNKKIKIGIIGGKLQGFEVAYLAKIENYDITIIDKKKFVISKLFSNKFICFDITKHLKKYLDIVNKMDYIIPTNENTKTLKFIFKHKDKLKCKLIFDFNSYWKSRSKKISKEIFKLLGFKTPLESPKNPPFIIKPIDQSGSIGVKLIKNNKQKFIIPKNYLVEQYIEGPIISLEIFGNGNIYNTSIETVVHIDEIYDCYKVTTYKENNYYRTIGLKIAKYINLNGIMDIEAIENNNNLYLLEIDARFPSQTPICVYHSSGMNLIKELISLKKNIVNNHYNLNNYCIV